MTADNRLPFGSEFSAAQISLPVVLEVLRKHAGDVDAIEAAFVSTFFDGRSATYGMNCRLGAVGYGLLDPETFQPTPIANELFEVRGDNGALVAKFSRHILINANGETLLAAVRDLQAAGKEPTLIALRRILMERGLDVPAGTKHISTLRSWFAVGGIVPVNVGDWTINEKRLNELRGISTESTDALGALTREQRDFLKALANAGGGGPHLSSAIRSMAEATYGTEFNEKDLPKQVLYPLEAAGFVKLDRGSGNEGRGSRPLVVTASDTFNAKVIVPLIEQLEAQVNADLRPYIRKPFATILKDLDSASKHVRGLALETVAIQLMRMIDLRYVKTRLRGAKTGGAEVDVIFESSRLVFSRWQVQCKYHHDRKKSGISLEDVAKEVGLTKMLKSNVIIMVTNARVGNDAKGFAREVMKDSNLHIAFVDGGILEAIASDPGTLTEALSAQAAEVMKLKAITHPITEAKE